MEDVGNLHFFHMEELHQGEEYGLPRVNSLGQSPHLLFASLSGSIGAKQEEGIVSSPPMDHVVPRGNPFSPTQRTRQLSKSDIESEPMRRSLIVSLISCSPGRPRRISPGDVGLLPGLGDGHQDHTGLREKQTHDHVVDTRHNFCRVLSDRPVPRDPFQILPCE
jgi:hypothetical protein